VARLSGFICATNRAKEQRERTRGAYKRQATRQRMLLKSATS
jgi:hypothetical protein